MFSSSSSSGGGGFGGAGGGGGAGGCGCGSNGGNGGSSGVWSSGMKKQQKRPKIPKRGPGVAELEKILREQEKSDGGININTSTTSSSNTNNVEGFSVSHPCFNPHRRSPPPPPPPPPPPMPAVAKPPPPSHHIPIAPRLDHLSPPPPGLYGYSTAKQQEGRNFPEQPLFPMIPSSCDGLSQPDNHRHHYHSANPSSSKNFSSESSNNHHHHQHLWSSYSALPPKRHCTNQYSSSMAKQFLGPCPPPPSSSSLTTGLFNHEPPSSQSSYFNGMSARNPTEEPKMVGMKRPHPSSSYENSLVPSSNFQASPLFSNLISRPQNKPSSNDSHNFISSNNDCFRDVKWGGPLGFNSNRSRFGSEISDGGSGHFYSLISGGGGAPTPPIPSPHMFMFQRELSNNNNHQVPEERMEESYPKSESSSGGSDQKRLFYNFLELKEAGGTNETILGSNHEGSEEAGINGPDLTLKL